MLMMTMFGLSAAAALPQAMIASMSMNRPSERFDKSPTGPCFAAGFYHWTIRRSLRRTSAAERR